MKLTINPFSIEEFTKHLNKSDHDRKIKPMYKNITNDIGSSIILQKYIFLNKLCL